MRLPAPVWKIVRSRKLRILLACAPFAVALAVALFYVGVNYTGKRALQEHLTALKAAAIPSSAKEYFRSCPEEENALVHPALEAEFASPVFGALDEMTTPLPGVSRRKPKAEPLFARPSPVVDWLDPPASGSEEDAAREFLALLESSGKRWSGIKEAVRRPCISWKPYLPDQGGVKEVVTALVPRVLRFQRLARHAKDRAILHLASRDPAGAAEEVETLFRITRLLQTQQPTLLSCMVASSVFREAYSVVWEGAVRGSWREEELAAFECALGSFDPAMGYLAGLRGEFAFMVAGLRELPGDRGKLAITRGWEPEWEEILARLRGIWRWSRPVGLDLLESVEDQKAILDIMLVAGEPAVRVDPAMIRPGPDKGYRAIMVDHGGNPFFVGPGDRFSHVLLDGAVGGEAGLALLRTAIALERHRLAHGSYPRDLGSLVPGFLPALLPDPFSGGSLRYVLQADGSPWLWSVGPDRIDEGGLPHRDRTKGDLVWITKPIPGFTKASASR